MSTSLQVLIIDDFENSLQEDLAAYGCTVKYLPGVKAEDVPALLPGVHILVVRSKCDITKALIEKASSLQIIARGGAGMDNVDEAYAAERGIVCVNAPEGNRDAVGEHTIALLLALSNNIVKGHNEITRGTWDRDTNRGFEIGGKTVGIIGYGNTGSAVAKKLSSFNCNLIAYDKYKPDFTDQFVAPCSMTDIFEKADIVSLHVPLTAETRYMVNDSFVAAMKKTFVLLNASRGKVVQLSAVLKGLENGSITHFGADVLENEKLSTLNVEEKARLDRLTGMPNVVLTPHVAGWSKESYVKISQVLSRKIRAQIDELKKKQDRY